MKFRTLVAGLTLTLLSGAAFAQTTAASGADATLAGPGLTMGKMAGGPLKYVNIQDSDLMTSKLVGVDCHLGQSLFSSAFVLPLAGVFSRRARSRGGRGR